MSKDWVPALVNGRLQVTDPATFVRRDMDYSAQGQQTTERVQFLGLTS